MPSLITIAALAARLEAAAESLGEPVKWAVGAVLDKVCPGDAECEDKMLCPWGDGDPEAWCIEAIEGAVRRYEARQARREAKETSNDDTQA
jgi:hypothetical protein